MGGVLCVEVNLREGGAGYVSDVYTLSIYETFEMRTRWKIP